MNAAGRTTRWRRVFGAAVLAAVTAGVARGASAQASGAAPASAEPLRAPYTVRYDHLTGAVELRDPRERLLESWARWDAGSPLLLRIPADRPVRVVVTNANSLLYDYAVSADVVARRELRRCADLGTRFAAAGLVSGLSVAAGASAPVVAAGGLLGTIVARRDSGTAKGGPSAISEQSLAGTLEEIRVPVLGFLDWSAGFGALASALNDSLALVAELAESYPIDSLLAELQRQLEPRLPGASQPARVPRLVQQHVDSVAPDLRVLRTLADAVLRGGYAGSPQDPAAREAVELSRRVDSSFVTLRAGYRQLQLVLVRIATARARSQQTFVVGPSGDARRIVLQLRATTAFPDVARQRGGGVEVFTEPTSSALVCEVEVGVAWMRRPPAYAVVNGVVVDEAASGARSTIILGLRVSAPHLPVLGAVGALGIGAAGRLDALLGASLRPVAPLRIIAGAAWQSQQRLPGGLAVGDTVPADAWGRVGRSYRASFFWGLTIGF